MPAVWVIPTSAGFLCTGEVLPVLRVGVLAGNLKKISLIPLQTNANASKVTGEKSIQGEVRRTIGALWLI